MKILYLPNAYSQQRQREKKRKVYPVLLAMQAEWYRRQGHEVDWGNAQGKYDLIVSAPEGLPFLKLPWPDRQFTRWWEYQDNGNFKYHPATYILAANRCWWGKCVFCVENGKPYEVRQVEDVWHEIMICKDQGFKEIFDDSGTFPIGDWLRKFCRHGIAYKKPVVLGCNMRMVDIDYKMMKDAGFRMLLFGLESANKETLDRINKGVKVEDVKYIKRASAVGLEPHVAVMFGYPWESDSDALRTLQLVWRLLKKGYAKTAQASIYRPPDMLGNTKHSKFVNKIYNAAFHSQFWWVRRNEDIGYLWKGIKAWYRDKTRRLESDS